MDEESHARLVRLAFWLFNTGNDQKVGAETRLSRARSVVDQAIQLSRSPKGTVKYSAVRRRVLRRILEKEPYPRPVRNPTPLRNDADTPQEEAATLQAALKRMLPQRRAIYLLHRLEGLSEGKVAQELTEVWQSGRRTLVLRALLPSGKELNRGINREHRLKDIVDVLAAADEAVGLPVQRQRELLTGPAFDPERTRLQ